MAVAWYEQARRMTIICYYPSEPYIACLDAIDEAELVADINCKDLFNGKDPRERIVVYTLVDMK